MLTITIAGLAYYSGFYLGCALMGALTSLALLLWPEDRRDYP